MAYRLCTCCRETKAETEFYLDRGRRRSRCKACSATADREYRVAGAQRRQIVLVGRRRQYLLQAKLKRTAGDVVTAARFVRWAVETHYAMMKSRVWPDAWRGLGYAHSYRMRPRKFLRGES